MVVDLVAEVALGWNLTLYVWRDLEGHSEAFQDWRDLNRLALCTP